MSQVPSNSVPSHGTLTPVAASERIVALDVIRGFALLGIFLMTVEFFNRPMAELGDGLAAGVTGLEMTTLDGPAKGGVLVAAAEKFGLPIHASGVGEPIEDLRPFDPREVARAIAGVAAIKERNG